MKTRKNFVGSFCALFLGAALLLAQTTGVIRGTVTSPPDGRPVANASVIVTSSSGATQNAVTGPDGTFAVQNLSPGPYSIQVQMNGFKTLTQNNVQVTAGTPANLAFALEAGATSDRVQVTGTAINVQSDDATIKRTYNSAGLTDLPIQDLNTQQLTEKMPGIPPVTYQTANPTVPNAALLDPQSNRVWSTDGQQPFTNNAFLDGIENLEPVNGIAVHVPALASQQEMTVATSNYQEQMGRALGSELDQTVKAGTNAFHGQLFEFNSNDWFDARNYFDPKGFPQSRYTSNEFGGEAGGALIRNHLFAMLSYEGDYIRAQNPDWVTTPSLGFGNGNFSALPYPIYNPYTNLPFTGNRIPTALLNPTALAITSALPLPNASGQEYNYFANVPFINDGNRVDARLDEHFTDKTALSLRYGLSYYNTTQDAIFPGLSADGGSSRLRADNAMLGLNHVFGQNMSTTLDLGFNRYSDPISAQYSPYSASYFGFTGGNGGLPYISIAGMPALGVNPNYPQINKENNYTLNNTWRASIGRNEFSFGIDFWNIRWDGFQNLLYGPAGAYTFEPGATSAIGATSFAEYGNAYAAFLLGASTTAGVIQNSYLPSYLSWQLGGFAGDRVKLTDHFTIDLGLRYDRFWPVQPRGNSADYSVFNPTIDNLIPLGSGATRFGDLHGHNLNFAPRIGLAYRIGDRTVVRAGYGMSYWDPIQFEASALVPYFTGAGAGVAGSYDITRGFFGVTPGITASSYAPNVPLYFTDSSFKTPYVQFFNFGIQRDLTHSILLGLNYVGNLDRDLPFTQNLNAAAPGTGITGLPYYYSAGITAPVYLRGTGYSSNYNAFQFNMTKRFSDGLSFSLAYTWSKAEDYGAGLAPFLNNINPAANFGVSDYDRTNVVTLTHNWRVPIGTGTSHLGSGLVGHILGPWQLDGVLTYGTGLPYTPTADAAACACPGNTPTANYVAGGSSVSPYSSASGYLGLYSSLVPYTAGTGTFSQPYNSFGTLGRNTFRGPDYLNYDLALTREFVFVERTRLDLRAEAYNLANSAHFINPYANVNAINFGQPTATAYGFGPRTLQLALKLVF